MEKLFVGLKNCRLEWRIEDSFCIRIRELERNKIYENFERETGDVLKFNIRVYKVITT